MRVFLDAIKIGPHAEERFDAASRRTLPHVPRRHRPRIQAAGCRCRRREELKPPEAQSLTHDRLADTIGEYLRGLRGPGGIQLHSPELSRVSRPLNHYLRFESGLGGRVRELAILVTARECDSQFEWAAHEAGAARREGIRRRKSSTQSVIAARSTASPNATPTSSHSAAKFSASAAYLPRPTLVVSRSSAAASSSTWSR